MEATATIPIVVVNAGDPVGIGLSASSRGQEEMSPGISDHAIGAECEAAWSSSTR